jgi:hypothetical protein
VEMSLISRASRAIAKLSAQRVRRRRTPLAG